MPDEVEESKGNGESEGGSSEPSPQDSGIYETNIRIRKHRRDSGKKRHSRKKSKKKSKKKFSRRN